MKQDEEAFATPQSTTSPPFIRDDENDILPVADAFAKFKNMENMHMENNEIKPVRKMPPVWDIKSSTKGGLPENKEIGHHLSSYPGKRNDKPEEKLPAVSKQEPTMNNMSPASKDSVKSQEKKRVDVDHEAHEDDVPPVGITKRLVTQWKLMDTPDGSPVHWSYAPVVSTSSIGRSTTEMALDGPPKISNTVAQVLQLGNGFPATEAGSSSENTLELVRKHKEIVPHDTELFRKRGGQEMTAIAPLDFTRNQLAKFKELEAMAQKSANPYPLPKKVGLKVHR